jgi:hypothetical protein
MVCEAKLAGLVLALLALGFTRGPETQDQKRPIPDAAAQKEAEKLIREIFKEDFARKTPADRLTLARKLIEQSSQSKDDPATRFVLLREARDLAVQSGELPLALEATQAIGSAFEGEILSMKAGVLASLAKNAKTPEVLQALARSYLSLADEAALAENHDLAEKSADQAGTLARRAKDLPLTTKSDTRQKQAADHKARFEKVKKARETLQVNPADPAANLAVGLYECAVRGNWETGPALLAKGSDPVLRDLAERELARPSGPAEESRMGDGWWDLSEKEKDAVLKEGLLKRARTWYRRAVPGLSGLPKAKAEKRMGDPLADQFGGTWIDITDPKNFGQSGKPGDAMTLTPKAGAYFQTMISKMPDGEFDGLMVRVQHTVENKGIGMVFYEGDSTGGYFDTGGRRYVVLVLNAKKWEQAFETPLEPKLRYTITVISAGGEYIHYVDGVEVGRQKARMQRVAKIGFWVEHEAMTFDQIRLRRRD